MELSVAYGLDIGRTNPVERVGRRFPTCEGGT